MRTRATAQAVGGVIGETAPPGKSCPAFRSSLRGMLCLGRRDVEVTGGDSEPCTSNRGGGPAPQEEYDMSGARVALTLCVFRDRAGAERDVEALERLCRTLGFESSVRRDPTAQDFRDEMAQFRAKLDGRGAPVSCALVTFMAHGGRGGRLLGADGQEVEPEDLIAELLPCRALSGGVKLFLLQSCRGGQRDSGAGAPGFPWLRRWLRGPPAIPSHADILRVYGDVRGRSSMPAPSGLDQADTLRVYAAADGCVAYRDEQGSDFIQTVVEVLLAAPPHRDLLDLLTEVNRKMCEADVLGPNSDDICKMNLEIQSSLRKRLCLQAPLRLITGKGESPRGRTPTQDEL
ncbi:putative caspase-16 [Tachyglossus aculeatus]|uniref:putative caspase-16 n=1 Tax=Tachyglossus aculeatus TaxID=9261 RepID=UPI0018F4065F|nr:putative caspase-16 [Tachyglossus aculeatus]